ncbi:cation transporter [Bacillus sp. BGMRC 2118]|nr:cation transporter [Bacillus sp. BGMRC 2118]
MGENQDRFRQGEIAALSSIAANIILAIIKGIVGVISNSKALLADAVNSASDVVGSIAVYIGVRAAKAPPDEDHPYGHGKAESIAAIIVAVLVFMVGIEIGRSSIESFFHEIQPPTMPAIYAILFSILVKEIMFRYKIKVGKRINSDAIIVNAYEDRSDVFSSLAALVGIGASILGGKFGIDWLVYADPVAGIFVSVFVIIMAWKLGSESIHTALDHVLHDEETKEMRDLVLQVEGVKKIDGFFAREHGHYVIVDLKISVDPYITVEEGHKIGKNVKSELIQHANVQDVFIHVNPYNEE